MVSPTRSPQEVPFHATDVAPAQHIVEDIQRKLLPKIAKVTYNTMPILFEFLNSIRKGKESSDWAAELNRYTPGRVSDIVGKYHASSLALLAALAQEEITVGAQKGLLFFEERPLSSLFNLSVIHSPRQMGEAVEWPEARNALHNKTGLVWMCEDGERGSVTVVRPNFQGTNPIEQYPSREAFEAAYKRFNTGGIEKTADPWPFIKALIGVTLVHVVEHTTTKEILKIHLIDGKIEIENCVTAALPVTTTQDATFSLLDMLLHREELFTVRIQKQLYHPKGSEAFDLIVGHYAAHFGLPPDFADNLRFLLMHREKFFKELVPTPGPILLDVWPHYKEVEDLYNTAQKVQERAHPSLYSEISQKRHEADVSFENGVQFLMHNEKEKALLSLKEAEEKYTQVIRLCAEKGGVTLNVVLDENPLDF